MASLSCLYRMPNGEPVSPFWNDIPLSERIALVHNVARGLDFAPPDDELIDRYTRASAYLDGAIPRHRWQEALCSPADANREIVISRLPREVVGRIARNVQDPGDSDELVCPDEVVRRIEELYDLLGIRLPAVELSKARSHWQETLRSARAYVDSAARKNYASASVQPAGIRRAARMRAVPIERRNAEIGRDELDLRAWQQEAVAWWRSYNCKGIIEAVTGTGKTRVGIWAALEAAAHERPTTILVPTIDLVHQWKKSFPVESQRLVSCHDGENARPPKIIAISTVQSALLRGLAPVHAENGLIIADEVHRYGAENWARALSENYAYRLGLTATLERLDDGVEQFINPYFTSNRFSVDFTRARRDNIIAPFTVTYVGVDFNGYERRAYDRDRRKADDLKERLHMDYLLPREPFGEFMKQAAIAARKPAHKAHYIACGFMKHFQACKRRLATAEGKMDRISELQRIIAASNKTLIFGQTKAACKMALNHLQLPGKLLTADTTRQDRRTILDEFETQHECQLLAAPRLADEGLDIPDADVGVILSGSSTRRQSIQRLGRILRLKADGRSAQLYVLYVMGTGEDPANYYSSSQSFLDFVEEAAERTIVVKAHESLSGLPNAMGQAA